MRERFGVAADRTRMEGTPCSRPFRSVLLPGPFGVKKIQLAVDALSQKYRACVCARAHRLRVFDKPAHLGVVQLMLFW